MCKFNNRLFTFILIFLTTFCNAAPGYPFNKFVDDYREDYDYDLTYDQRQNGTENYRVRLDGFLIAFPPDVESDNNNYTDELINLLGSDFLDPFEKLEDQEDSKYPNYEKDEKYQNEGHVEKQETFLNSSEQTMLDKNGRTFPKTIETIIPRSKLHKPRKNRFQLMNFLKLFKRNHEE